MFNNSLLREAYALDSNNQRIPNAWFVSYSGTWYSLGFSKIVNDFSFSAPSLINPGGNYNAIVLWDPTLTPSYGIGITYQREINKIIKNGNNIEVIKVADYRNSGINYNFNAATIGDFNNDNIPDIFVIGSNEDSSSSYLKIKGAYSISGRIDSLGNLSFNQPNTITTVSISDAWNQVYVKWTADAVKSRALKYENGVLKRVPMGIW